jgi:hypothetical protein
VKRNEGVRLYEDHGKQHRNDRIQGKHLVHTPEVLASN